MTEKNGRKRLDEIKQAVKDGDFDDLLELVFIPLYGRDANRSELTLDVLTFELELCKKQILSKITLAATMVMANKIVDKAILKTIWEDLKMVLEAFKFAEEEGIEKGAIQKSREYVIDVLELRFDTISQTTKNNLNDINDASILKLLHKKAIQAQTVDEFEKFLSSYL